MVVILFHHHDPHTPKPSPSPNPPQPFFYLSLQYHHLMQHTGTFQLFFFLFLFSLQSIIDPWLHFYLNAYSFSILKCLIFGTPQIAGMKGNGDDPRSFAMEAKNDEQTIGKVREGKSSRRVLMREREESHESSRRDKYPPKSLPLIPSSARRRKGIPHRAPFGS